MQHPTLGGIRRALSETRIRAYTAPGDQDEYDAIARYLWNGALCFALTPALHAVEITFRNAMYESSVKVMSKKGISFKHDEVPCWLDATPTMLLPTEEARVEEAKEDLRRRRDYPQCMTTDRLIAKLGFGFWTGLCKSPYEQGRKDGPQLWPGLTEYLFPFVDNKSRSEVFHHMRAIRDFRNRIAHHDPIWDHKVVEFEATLIEKLRWMNQHIALAVLGMSTDTGYRRCGPRGVAFESAQDFRPGGLRSVAGKILVVKSGEVP
ncbi:MAG: hypothetical protein WD737_10720 [Gemmatimonadota bacterium]